MPTQITFLRKGLLVTVLILALSAALTGCGGTEAARTQKPAEQTASTEAAAPAGTTGDLNFKMHFVDPASSPYAMGGEKIADLVSEATDGKIHIEVLSDSALGGERETLEMAMDNQLDIATCANSVMTNYIPQMNILDQAYLWKNANEAHAAVDGRLGELIRERAQTLGLHVIGFEESGFRNTFSTKPIESLEDFDGITIRTMENKYHQAAFEAFGALPVAMAYDQVFPALQDGSINACENATANCLNSGYYEITKHVTNTRHAFVYILLCMSDDAWNRIPEDLQTPFLEAVQEGVAWERDHLDKANADAAAELQKLGVIFHDIDVAQLQQAYRKAAGEKGFTFDQEWQDAMDDAIRSIE